MKSGQETEGQLSQELSRLRRRIAQLESENDSLQHLQILFENAEDGIYIRDLDGTVKAVNQKFLQIHGLKLEDALGRPSMELLSFSPKEKVRIQKQIQKAIATGRPPASLPEVRFIRPDGSTGYVQINLGFIKQKNRGREIFGIVRDITERKKMEEALRQSYFLYENLLQSISAGVYEVKLNNTPFSGKITFISDYIEKILGYSAKTWMRDSSHWFQSIHPDDLKKVSSATLSTRALGQGHDIEYRMVHANGSIVWIRDIANLIYEEDGSRKLRGLFVDITKEKRAAVALRQSEERFSKAFYSSPVAMSISTTKGRYLDVNQAFIDLVGYTRNEMVGHTPTELNLWVSKKEQNKARDEFEKTGMVRNNEFTFRTKSGKLRIGISSVERIELSDKKCLLALTQDITERKQAEQAIRKLSDERRALASKVMTAQEQERTRIARELHDVLGQTLTALKMDGEWLSRYYQNSQNPDEAKQIAQALCEKLDRTIDLVRTLSYQLRPPVLDDLDVGSALESLVAEMSKQSSIVWETQIDSGDDALPSELATGVYRIAQEAITNVLRHSRARHACLSLRINKHGLSLVIEDDGKGLSPSKLKNKKSLGLVGMRERAALLGGTLAVDSAQRRGTLLRVTIPLKKPTHRRGAA